MSDRLKRAFDEASRLPEDAQDAFALFLLAEIRDEKSWNERFGASQDALALLAEEARRQDGTQSLDDLVS